jgi:hypothetical protein
LAGTGKEAVRVTAADRHRRRILDTHVHIFPDKVAAAALPALQEESGVEARFDGTLRGPLAAIKQTGVTRSVVRPVATRSQSVAAVNDRAAALPAGARAARLQASPGVPGFPSRRRAHGAHL